MHASQPELPVWHGTTILTVRKGGKVVIGGDGQGSIGPTGLKSTAKKAPKLLKSDAAGEQTGAISGAIDPRRGRTCQGLAHRPLSAPAGGDDDRRRQGSIAGPYRY